MSVLSSNKKDLKYFAEHPPDILVEFCKSSIDYLNNGPNEKKYAAVAKKLDTTPEHIQRLIESLVSLLIDCTRASITESTFQQLAQSLDLNDEHSSVLWQFVCSRKSLVESVLKGSDDSELHFRDLEWRVEARIASRSMLRQAVPKITMKFHLDREEVNEHKTTLSDTAEWTTSKQVVLCETDPNNLVHMIGVLEQALLEGKTHRTRNMVKTFQQ